MTTATAYATGEMLVPDEPPFTFETRQLPWPPRPEDEPQPAAPEPEPQKEPTPPSAAEVEALVPPAPQTPEERRAQSAARKAEELRAKARGLQRSSRLWATAVILISLIITIYGSGNAHTVFHRHDTADPWAWFPYPALEAALVVEIQIGGALAEHGRRVRFWGAALRFVTAVAAVTVCVYGPAEYGDLGGALLHAIGPVVQFWLAEFLARSRTQFKAAIEDLMAKAEGREQAAAAPSRDRDQRSPKRSPKPARPVSKTVPEPPGTDRSPARETGPELVLTPVEKKALAAIAKRGERVSKRTVINEVRALGGAIGTTRALQIAREWGPVSGGPDLSVVTEQEA
jgi:hypothetical protein